MRCSGLWKGEPEMADSQLTKRALSAAMKELMAERPMEKIRIGDIVERCNMNRQSFYYHFKDKYDLVNWIFIPSFSRIFSVLSIAPAGN